MIANTIKPGFADSLLFKKIQSSKPLREPFPSVTKAPIDTSKFKSFFNFKFTKIEDAIRETVIFYNLAYKMFPNERRRTAKELVEDNFDDEKEGDEFREIIRNYKPTENY